MIGVEWVVMILVVILVIGVLGLLAYAVIGDLLGYDDGFPPNWPGRRR